MSEEKYIVHGRQTGPLGSVYFAGCDEEGDSHLDGELENVYGVSMEGAKKIADFLESMGDRVYGIRTKEELLVNWEDYKAYRKEKYKSYIRDISAVASAMLCKKED